MNLRERMFGLSVALCVSVFTAQAQDVDPIEDVWSTGDFDWVTNGPVAGLDPSTLPESIENPFIAVKDPSIVRFDGHWHLFCSVRRQQGGEGRIRIAWMSFADWKDAPAAKWRLLNLTDDYHGAPQVFWFEPQQTWYLIYQAADESRDVAYGACYSTTNDINDPHSWTLPRPMLPDRPESVPAGLDFWVICDDEKAYLFYTSLNGRMWRAETSLSAFPLGWSIPVVALQADIFEASHTYRLKGRQQYVTLIEAQNGQRRYYKAYLADRLAGEWKPLAATREKPFASPLNVKQVDGEWTDSFSHGELIRIGHNQQLEVDPAHLQFLFQGVSAKRQSGNYGSIPWRLGILKSADQK